MKIKHFIIFLNLLVVLILGIFVYSVYYRQERVFVAFISSTINKTLQNSKYIASEIGQKRRNIFILKPFLDRESLENSFIKGFLLTKDDKILLKSGDSNLFIPSKDKVDFNLANITLKKLLNKEIYAIKVPYWINNEVHYYTLYMFLNKNKIFSIFEDLKREFVIIYIFFVMIVILSMNYLIQGFIVKPLEIIKNKAKVFENERKYETRNFYIKEIKDIDVVLEKTFAKMNQLVDSLYKMSLTDHLTGLGNRNRLIKEVNLLIKNKEKFALIFLDLDNFKEINDFFGHSSGDEIIKQIARKLKSVIKPPHLITRIGGDEFILILKTDDIYEIKAYLNKIVSILNNKWKIKNEEVTLSASMGIAVYPNDGISLDELLKNADIAMYEAKKKGKNRYMFFTEEVKEKANNEFILKNKLKKAIENGEFELYFQPQVDGNRKVNGAEALIRWNLEGKVISPGIFIPLAERSGLINEIGLWVMENVFKTSKEWENKEFLNKIRIAFNISVVQIRNDDFLDEIERLVEKTGCDTSKLEVEITESVFIQDQKRAKFFLRKLKDMGFDISLDDFGTGYSSLSVLKDYDIDILKIDKTFVDEVEYPDGQIYVKTIIDMAKNLKLKTIAEGVEKAEQFEVLKRLGADYFQGYYFAKPLKKEEFEKYVIENFKSRAV